MAYKMTYTDASTGATFPESVWLPMGIYTDFSQPNGNVVFLGYATKEIATANLLYVMGMGGQSRAPIGSHSYPLSAEKTRTLALSEPKGSTVLDVMSSLGYEAATTILDKADPTEEDPGRMVSFFDGAEEINLLG